jgi:hypothetical protein
MNNLFDKVATQANNLGEKITGPNYNYPKMIKKPSELGVGDRGTFGQMNSNIAAIIAYNQLLISGKSKASKAPGGNPLGGRFFLDTLGKCTDVNEKDPKKRSKPRSLYVSNVPSGNIPLVSDLAGMNFSMLRGLVPGLASNIDSVNPIALFSSFMQKAEPDCMAINLPVISDKRGPTSATRYVPLNELREHADNDDDLARRIRGPLRTAEANARRINSSSGKEGFMNYEEDAMTNIYLSSMSLLLFYIFYRLYKKSHE